jgi:hypothetical protein
MELDCGWNPSVQIARLATSVTLKGEVHLQDCVRLGTIVQLDLKQRKKLTVQLDFTVHKVLLSTLNYKLKRFGRFECLFTSWMRVARFVY